MTPAMTKQTHYYASATGNRDDLREVDPRDIANAFAAGQCRLVHSYSSASYLATNGADVDTRNDNSVPMYAQVWTAIPASVDAAVQAAAEHY